ncbi:hypothetical protein HMI55_003326 [Coelomomyces lativittatus]|nr:hypothetical protein HMI55_003326 [Coelomomyces lativittatus]KAJ1501917.1 hypothetical protein HMI56_002969 [Coelomomyces lativittatus]
MSIHGQNRLAGNSLLDCVVFGRIAGRQASSSQRQPSNPPTLTFTSPPSSRIPSLLGRLKATFLSTLSLSLSTTPSSSSFTCTSCTPPSYDDQVMVGMVTLFLALFPLWMLFHRWVRKRHVPL